MARKLIRTAIVHRNLELVGRYLGELQNHSTQTVVNILLSPEYLRLRNLLVKALEKFPEARRAVANVLQSEEGGAVERMSAPMIDVTPAIADTQ